MAAINVPPAVLSLLPVNAQVGDIALLEPPHAQCVLQGPLVKLLPYHLQLARDCAPPESIV
jgi:hypothetical protein